ncbi:hypothetical protein GCM10017691_13100 [Pseudonocardia petroleophila]
MRPLWNRGASRPVQVGMFTADATAFLSEIADDNTPAFFAAHRDRRTAALDAPMRALAAALAEEFGPLRVLRPQRNRRFRPDAPPYRTDAGLVAADPPRAVLLSAAALTVSAGPWRFDAGQRTRFRAAVDDGLAALLEGWTVASPRLTGLPRGFRADAPHLALLRLGGLQVERSWPVGEWLGTDEPVRRVRETWRAAGPLLRWLDRHVGPADPVVPRPRPAVPG